jgi:predicted transcriptional regulator
MRYINTDKNLCCDDVIQCIFDLNSLDMNVYKKLDEKSDIRADVLANKLKRERSTVYRSLQKLTCAGLCIKKTKKIKSGGYYHVYSRNNVKETKEKLKKCIEDWYEKMKETIEQIS